MSLMTNLIPVASGFSAAAPKRRTPVPEFDFVLFGAGGDLAARKLFPSLLQRDAEDILPARGRILCIGREPLDAEAFAAHALKYVGEASPDVLARFRGRIQYQAMDVTDPSSYAGLAALLEGSPNYRTRCGRSRPSSTIRWRGMQPSSPKPARPGAGWNPCCSRSSTVGGPGPAMT